MANYSIELRTIIEDMGFNLFDFNYPFYSDDPNKKKVFEQKFIDHYYFDEIGFETVARFKHRLKEKLTLKGEYYKKLYETELASQKIDFLLNKDLTETFLREIEKDNIQNVNAIANSNTASTSTSNNDTSSQSESNGKGSNIENGVSSVSLESNYLTNINKDNNTSNINSTSNGTSKANTDTSNTADTTDHGTETESTTFISKGNIGVTSSAELLERWRGVLQSMDNIIIDDCRDLFMLIY